eukprot:gene32080-33726_t
MQYIGSEQPDSGTEKFATNPDKLEKEHARSLARQVVHYYNVGRT